MGNFYIRKGILVNCCGVSGDVVIPEGVTEIGRYAFGECESLTSLTIPDSAAIIAKNAFSDVPSVTYKGRTYTVGDIDKLYALFNYGSTRYKTRVLI